MLFSAYTAAEISSQEWRVPQAMGPTALWVQQPSERHGWVSKLTQTGTFTVGKCLSLSLQLLQESYWHPEIFYNACSLYGHYRKVIVIVTVACKRHCPQNIGKESRIIFLCGVSVLFPNEDCWQTSGCSCQSLDSSCTLAALKCFFKFTNGSLEAGMCSTHDQRRRQALHF